MVISGWWWMLVCGLIGLALAAAISARADRGGRHCLDFGDAVFGFWIPLLVLMGSLLFGALAVGTGARLSVW